MFYVRLGECQENLRGEPLAFSFSFFFFFWKNLLIESIEITINSLPSKFFKTAVSLGQNALSYLIEILNFLFNFKIKLRKINISMR
jgi:hypothetical protein